VTTPRNSPLSVATYVIVLVLIVAMTFLATRVTKLNARVEKALRLHGLDESVFDGPQAWEGNRIEDSAYLRRLSSELSWRLHALTDAHYTQIQALTAAFNAHVTNTQPLMEHVRREVEWQKKLADGTLVIDPFVLMTTSQAPHMTNATFTPDDTFAYNTHPQWWTNTTLPMIWRYKLLPRVTNAATGGPMP
jgi:hypothetical protein